MRIEKVYKTSRGTFWSKLEAEKKVNRTKTFGSRPGDPVEYEPVQEVFSQQWMTHFVSGVTTDDQAVFFAHKQPINIGKLIIAEGTVKAHRDNSTQLNRVKVI